MKKTKLLGLLLVVSVLTTPMSVLGHSGRTDSNGGHWDRKAGTYHYHNGGGGSSNSSYIPSKSVEAAVIIQKPFISSIVGTNIRTYINGYEVPTWAYNGSNSCAVVIAEDLKDYGFDINWNGLTNTLEVKRNSAKAITPIPMDSYRNLAVGATAYNIVSDSNVKILLKDGTSTYMPCAIFNLGGYMAISVDELKMFGDFTWDGEKRTVSINNR